MAKEKKIPTSEAALKRALKAYNALNNVQFYQTWNREKRDFILYFVDLDAKQNGRIWQGYLSDFYKKRKPLKPGVTKRLKKAIR